MSQQTKKLHKSNNRTICGVCGGLAEYFEMDSTVIKIIFLVLTFLGAGSPVLIYIILCIAMPDKPKVDEYAFTDEFDSNKDEFSYDEDDYKI